MTSCFPEPFGSNPLNVTWKVVRGDTAEILVQFFEPDEVTFYDTSSWTYSATAYDSRTDEIYDLDVEVGEGYVQITAQPEVTENWGAGSRPVVAELTFDLEVVVDNRTVWTPIIGRISVLGDVTGGNL
jgi:hypothetical protein